MKEESNIRVKNKEFCELLAKSIMVLLQFMKTICGTIYVTFFFLYFPSEQLVENLLFCGILF